MNLVLDTNVLIAAFIAKGFCHKLFIIHFFKPNATQQGLQARSYAT